MDPPIIPIISAVRPGTAEDGRNAMEAVRSASNGTEALTAVEAAAGLLREGGVGVLDLDVAVLVESVQRYGEEDAFCAGIAGVMEEISKGLLHIRPSPATEGILAQRKLDILKLATEVLSASTTAKRSDICEKSLAVCCTHLQDVSLQADIFSQSSLAKTLSCTFIIHNVVEHIKLLSFIVDETALQIILLSPLYRQVCEVYIGTPLPPRTVLFMMIFFENVFVLAAGGEVEVEVAGVVAFLLKHLDVIDESTGLLFSLKILLAICKSDLAARLPPESLSPIYDAVHNLSCSTPNEAVKLHLIAVLLNKFTLFHAKTSFETILKKIVSLFPLKEDEDLFIIHALQDICTYSSAFQGFSKNDEIFSWLKSKLDEVQGITHQNTISTEEEEDPILRRSTSVVQVISGCLQCRRPNGSGEEQELAMRLAENGLLEAVLLATVDLKTKLICVKSFVQNSFDARVVFVNSSTGLSLLLDILQDTQDLTATTHLKRLCLNIVALIHKQLCTKSHTAICAEMTTAAISIASQLHSDKNMNTESLTLLHHLRAAVSCTVKVGAVAGGVLSTLPQSSPGICNVLEMRGGDAGYDMDTVQNVANVLGVVSGLLAGCTDDVQRGALFRTVLNDVVANMNVLTDLPEYASYAEEALPCYGAYLEFLHEMVELHSRDTTFTPPPLLYSVFTPFKQFLEREGSQLPSVGCALGVITFMATHCKEENLVLTEETAHLAAHCITSLGVSAYPGAILCLKKFPRTLIFQFSKHNGFAHCVATMKTCEEANSAQRIALELLSVLYEVDETLLQETGVLVEGQASVLFESLLDLMGVSELLLRFDSAATTQEGSMRRTLDAWTVMASFAATSERVVLALANRSVLSSLVSFVSTRNAAERITLPAPFLYVLADLVRCDPTALDWLHKAHPGFLPALLALSPAKNDTTPLSEVFHGIAYLAAVCVLKDCHIEDCIDQNLDVLMQRVGSQVRWSSGRVECCEKALIKLRDVQKKVEEEGEVLVAVRSQVLHDADEAEVVHEDVVLDTPEEGKPVVLAAAAILCQQDYQFTEEEARVLAEPNPVRVLLSQLRSESIAATRSDTELSRIYACLSFASQNDVDTQCDIHQALLKDPRGGRTLKEACVYFMVLGAKGVDVGQVVGSFMCMPAVHNVMLNDVASADEAVKLLCTLMPTHVDMILEARVIKTVVDTLDQAVAYCAARKDSEEGKQLLKSYVHSVATLTCSGKGVAGWVRTWAGYGICKKLLATMPRLEGLDGFFAVEERCYEAVKWCVRWGEGVPEQLLGPDWIEEFAQIVRLRWNTEGTQTGQHAAAVISRAALSSTGSGPEHSQHLWEIYAAAFKLEPSSAPTLVDISTRVFLAVPCLRHVQVKGTSHEDVILAYLAKCFSQVKTSDVLCRWLCAVDEAVQRGVCARGGSALQKSVLQCTFAALQAGSVCGVQNVERLPILRGCFSVLVGYSRYEEMAAMVQHAIERDTAIITSIGTLLEHHANESSEDGIVESVIEESCGLLAAVARTKQFNPTFHRDEMYRALERLVVEYKGSPKVVASIAHLLQVAAENGDSAARKAAALGDGAVLTELVNVLQMHIGDGDVVALIKLAEALHYLCMTFPHVVEEVDDSFVEHLYSALHQFVVKDASLALQYAVLRVVTDVAPRFQSSVKLQADTTRAFFVVIRNLLRSNEDETEVLDIVSTMCLCSRSNNNALSIASPPRLPLGYPDDTDGASVLALLCSGGHRIHGLILMLEAFMVKYGDAAKVVHGDRCVRLLVQRICSVPAGETAEYVERLLGRELHKLSLSTLDALAEILGQRLMYCCSRADSASASVVSTCLSALPYNTVALDYICRTGALPDLSLEHFCVLFKAVHKWCENPVSCAEIYTAFTTYHLMDTLSELLGEYTPSMAYVVLYSAACYVHGVTTALCSSSVLEVWQKNAVGLDAGCPFVQALGYAYAVVINEQEGDVGEVEECGPFSVDMLVARNGTQLVGIASQGAILLGSQQCCCTEALSAIRSNEELKTIGNELSHDDMLREVRLATKKANIFEGQRKALQRQVEHLETVISGAQQQAREVETQHEQKVKQLHLDFEVATAERQMDYHHEEKKVETRHAAQLAVYGNSDIQTLRSELDHLKERLHEVERDALTQRQMYEGRSSELDTRHETELRSMQVLYRKKEATVMAQRLTEVERLSQEREDFRDLQHSTLEEQNEKRAQQEREYLEDKMKCRALEQRVKTLAAENSRMEREMAEYQDRHVALTQSEGKLNVTWQEKLMEAVNTERAKHEESMTAARMQQEQRFQSLQANTDRDEALLRTQHNLRMQMMLTEASEVDARLHIVTERSAAMKTLRTEKTTLLGAHRTSTAAGVVALWSSRLDSAAANNKAAEARTQRKVQRGVARLQRAWEEHNTMLRHDSDAYLRGREVGEITTLLLIEESTRVELSQSRDTEFGDMQREWGEVLIKRACEQHAVVEAQVKAEYDANLSTYKAQWEEYLQGQEKENEWKLAEYKQIAANMTEQRDAAHHQLHAVRSRNSIQSTQLAKALADERADRATEKRHSISTSRNSVHSTHHSSAPSSPRRTTTTFLEDAEHHARTLLHEFHTTTLDTLELQHPIHHQVQTAAPGHPRASDLRLNFTAFRYILGDAYNTRARKESHDDSLEYSYLDKLRCLFKELKDAEKEYEMKLAKKSPEAPPQPPPRPTSSDSGAQTDIEAEPEPIPVVEQPPPLPPRPTTSDSSTEPWFEELPAPPSPPPPPPPPSLEVFEEFTVFRQKTPEVIPCQRCTTSRATGEVVASLIASHEEEVVKLRSALAEESARLDELKGRTGQLQDHTELKAAYTALQNTHRSAVAERNTGAAEVKELKERLLYSAEQEAQLRRRIEQYNTERVQVEQVLQSHRAEAKARSDEVEKLRRDAEDSQQSNDASDVAGLLRHNEELGKQVIHLSNEIHRLTKRSSESEQSRTQLDTNEKALRSDGIDAAISAWRAAHTEIDSVRSAFVEMKEKRDTMKRERDDFNKELEIAMEREAASMAKYLRLLSAQHSIKQKERELGVLAWQTITDEEGGGTIIDPERVPQHLTRKSSSKRRLEPLSGTPFSNTQWASGTLAKSDVNKLPSTKSSQQPGILPPVSSPQTEQIVGKTNISRHIHGNTL